MRISELSRASGVALPTLKFYLRAGLLPPGESTAPNQADYSDEHLRRLRLIRVLTGVGGLSLRSVRTVLEALDDPSISLHHLIGIAHYASGHPAAGNATDQDLAEVGRLMDHLGWRVRPEAPGRLRLAEALATLRDLGYELDVAMFERYANAVDALAAAEVQTVPADAPRSLAVEGAVVGTVMYETVLVELRRLALEHHSASRFSSGSAQQAQRRRR